jgi:hypothetical protein
MNTRELNRLTNERHLFFSQINAIIPVISYLLNRLAIAKVECMPQDAAIVNSVNEVLRARTFEEVETIVAKHNEEIIGDLMSNFFSGDEATEKILRDMMRPKEDEDKRDPYDREPGEPGYRDREQDYIDDEGREDRGDGYGELGFDDFRDPDTGEDLWPKN